MFQLFNTRKSTGIFIREGKSYRELTEPAGNNSINAITEHLGYHHDQLYTHFVGFEEDDKIKNIVFEIFSKNVVFVLTSEKVTKVTDDLLAPFIRSIKFEDLYTDYTIEDLLQNGVNNRSLTMDFLSRILNIEDSSDDGVFYVEKLGYNLFFIDGILLDFQSADGLNEWAKHMRKLNPDSFKSYVDEAKHYWGNNLSKVIVEVNLQLNAWANVPKALENPYIEFHRTKFGVINFYMLNVCHHDKPITLNEFIEVNHGRFQTIEGTGNSKYFKLGNFVYSFQTDGQLISAVLVE